MRSILTLKSRFLFFACLLVVLSLAGCSSSSPIKTEAISNTVWRMPNRTHWTHVFLPSGAFLIVYDGKINSRGGWRIEGSEIKVTSGYLTGRDVIRGGQRNHEYADLSGRYRLSGDQLEYINVSNWFYNDFYTKVDTTAEKYVADNQLPVLP
jgi:hypothetical protein